MSKIRKKNKLDKCLFCDKEFYHHSWDNQRYCCKVCYTKYLKSLRPIRYCDVCKNEIQITRYRETRNNLYYCCRECYNNRRKENLIKLKRSTKFYQDLLYNNKCSCGEDKYYLLQIHHIDGNHSNNSPENLEIVCSNCHVKRHLKLLENGVYVYHPKSLTDRKILNTL